VRTLKGLIVAVFVVVVLGLVAGEVILRPQAERAVADDVRDRYRLDTRPAVKLGGFPFLLRVALGRLPSADGRLRDVTVEGFTVESAELHLRDVRFDPMRLARGGGDVTARAGQAAATVSDVDLTRYLSSQGLGLDVHFTTGEVRVAGTVSVARAQVTLVAAGSLQVSGQQLVFAPHSVEATSGDVTVPGPVIDAFRQTVSFAVPLPEIAGVRLTDIQFAAGTATLRANLSSYVLAA
jgi:hypothetical protein